MSLPDLLYPRTCINCHYLGSYLCPDCLKKLIYVQQQLCFHCRRPSLYGFTHPQCKKQSAIDGGMSILHYDNIMKRIMHQFKYRLATSVLDEFFNSINWFEQYVFYKRLVENAYLLPIPLHHERFLARGFNQALLIAQKINTYLRFPMGDFLVRCSNTKPQAYIRDKKLRRKNLQSAFKLSKTPNNDIPVILIDDILTTGATLQAAAQVLKASGIKKVYAFTLARG